LGLRVVRTLSDGDAVSPIVLLERGDQEFRLVNTNKIDSSTFATKQAVQEYYDFLND
jgi:hypothetical protein